MGVLGAYTAYNIINYGFGIAAYLLCTFFFVAGVNFLFGKKVFSLLRNLKYMLVGLVGNQCHTCFFCHTAVLFHGAVLWANCWNNGL